MHVKCLAVELLEVMLEETDPSSPILARKIIAQLIIKHLLFSMVQIWRVFSTTQGKNERSWWRNGLLRSYHTLKMIAYYKGSSGKEMSKNEMQACVQ